MPQSMQRAPWSCTACPANGSWNSRKSFTRSSIGRLRGSTRWSFRNPPSSPTAGEHLLAGLLLHLGPLGVGLAALARLLGGLLRSERRVLVLARLAGARGLVAAAVAGHVRSPLAGGNRTRAVAVTVLGDDGRLARLERLALGQLAQRALVVHRHDLHPRARELVPALEQVGRHRRLGPLGVLLDERTHLGEVVVARILELDQLGVAA